MEVRTIAVSQTTLPALTNGRPKNDLIGSVQRGLAILELLAQHPHGLNAKQVSLKSQLNLSTCYHLLNTLEHEGYVVKDPDSLAFKLSGKIGFTAFKQPTPAQLVKQLSPHVQTLQELSAETTYLSIWDGQEITLSAIIEAPQTVRVKSLVIGDTGANHASALGKAILAHLDRDDFNRYFAHHALPVFTENTITEPELLWNYLKAVRQQGYALDCEEFMRDVHCIGASIFDAHQQITAAIAISLPLSRAAGNRPDLVKLVKKVAASASRSLQILGHVRPALNTEDRP